MNKIIFWLFLCGTSVFSQEKYNSKDLLVSFEDLNLNSYSQDSTANALYLYEHGFTRFQDYGNYNLLTDYAAKLKLLNPEAYEHATIKIKLFKNGKEKEKINKLKATTYLLENGIKTSVELNPEQIYTEVNEFYDIVSFTFPNIKPGAVLVYSYQKESPFLFNFETWWFQEDIPKIYSEFETKIPANYNYNIKKIGELKFDIHEEELEKQCFRPTASATPGDCRVSKFAMINIPAFKDEPYLTSRYNYISRLVYELEGITNLDGSIKNYTKSWKDVDKEFRLDQGLGKQLKKTSLVKNILPEAIAGKPNDLAKAKEIYDFVKDNYKWNKEYNIHQDMNLKEIIDKKSGNVSAVNILLHNLYEDQGFKVNPVMSSTRSNGMVTKLYPVLSEFNYIMVQLELDDKKFLLDATEKNLKFGDIPFRSLNKYARILDLDKGSSWVEIKPASHSFIVYNDSIKINKDGSSVGKSQQVHTGYHALHTRNQLGEISNSEIFNEVSNPAGHTRTSLTTLKNKDDVSEALFINYNLDNESQKINDVIYFNPFSFHFFEKNPLTSAERNYPIDFGFQDTYNYSVNIEIPENHQVVELPKQKIISLPEKAGTMSFSVQQKDERNLSVQFRINFSQAEYASSFYPFLKEFFNAIIEVQSQSLIVLKENI